MSDWTLTKRQVARTVAGIGVGSLGIAAASAHVPAASASADITDEFEATNLDIERNDGTITAVTIAPSVHLDWDNFGGGLDHIALVVSAALADESGFVVIHEDTIEAKGAPDTDAIETYSGDSLAAVDGTVDLDLERRAITGEELPPESFGEDLGPGESETTTVELTLRVDVHGAQDETETVLETTTFDVTVTNPEGSSTTSATANPAVE